MSDWTDDEYNNMLGLVSEHGFPGQIIPEEYQGQNSNSVAKYPDRPKSEDRPRVMAAAGFQEVADDTPRRLLQTDSSDSGSSYVADALKKKIQQATGIKISRPDFRKLGIYNESTWVDANIVTKVKDQGRYCAASYAFAVAAAVEAAQASENGRAVPLSEQQIIDCTFDGKRRNFGCLGGSLHETIKYVKKKAILKA